MRLKRAPSDPLSQETQKGSESGILREQLATIYANSTSEDDYFRVARAITDVVEEADSKKPPHIKRSDIFLQPGNGGIPVNAVLKGSLLNEYDYDTSYEILDNGHNKYDKSLYKRPEIAGGNGPGKLLPPVTFVGEDLWPRSSVYYRHLDIHGNVETSPSRTTKRLIVSRLTSSPLEDLSFLRNTSGKPNVSSQSSGVVDKCSSRSGHKSSGSSIQVDQALVTSEVGSNWDYLLPVIANSDNPSGIERITTSVDIAERLLQSSRPESDESSLQDSDSSSVALRQAKELAATENGVLKEAAKRETRIDGRRETRSMHRGRKMIEDNQKEPRPTSVTKNGRIWLPDDTFLSGFHSEVERAPGEETSLGAAFQTPKEKKKTEGKKTTDPRAAHSPFRSQSGTKIWQFRNPSENSTSKKRKYRPRSKKGCWTCRVRHKACSEHRPMCENCRRLGLDCDYSLTRPQYMMDKAASSEKRQQIKGVTRELKKYMVKTNTRPSASPAQ